MSVRPPDLEHFDWCPRNEYGCELHRRMHERITSRGPGVRGTETFAEYYTWKAIQEVIEDHQRRSRYRRR